MCWRKKNDVTNFNYLVSFQLTCLRKPKYAPTNTKGTDIPNHNVSKASKVPKGMAADDCSAHKTRLRRKKIPKMMLIK